jgi:thiamine kinase-like enzyme
LDSALKIKDPFLFNWDEESIERFQHLLPHGIRTKVEYIREQVKALFIPFCCLSGDPNPTNWGVRDNGDLVLFDFERIGYGNPAIDLAITMPGFGSEDGSLELEIAKKYISYWIKDDYAFPFSEVELVNQIHLAKIWSALDYLANNHPTMSQQILSSFVHQLKDKILIYP